MLIPELHNVIDSYSTISSLEIHITSILVHVQVNLTVLLSHFSLLIPKVKFDYSATCVSEFFTNFAVKSLQYWG